MLYTFSIGSSTLKVEVYDALQKSIIDNLILANKLYINQLAHRVNVCTRDVYYALSQLRKA